MARTPAQYLADHNDDPSAALAAAVADVNTAYGENHTARSFRRTFEPILRDLGIPATQEGVDQLRELADAAQGAENVPELVELVKEMQGVLSDLGVNFDAPEAELQAQIESLPQRWKDGQTAMQERDTLRETEATRTLAEVAKASPSVLQDRLKVAGLTAKVDGEGDKRAVRVMDKDGKDLGELKEYAEKNWADYVPALFPNSTSPQGGIVVNGQAGAGAGQGRSDGNNPLAAAYNHGRTAPAEGQQVVRATAPTPTRTGGN